MKDAITQVEACINVGYLYCSKIVKIFDDKMLSKLRRSKSELSNQHKARPLQGMPALKKMRSSQHRHDMPKLDLSSVKYNPVLNEFERTGLPSQVQEMKFVGNNPREVTLNNHAEHARYPDGSNVSSNGKKKNAKINEHTDVVARNGSITTNEQNKNEKRRKEKKCLRKGVGLHSVKKIRMANRECNVSESMRALTPSERESIMCLEDVLRQHGEFDDINDVDVFGNEITRHRSASSSSDSSIGSIIDLVGNLSDHRLSSPSYPAHDDTYATIGTHEIMQNQDDDHVFRKQLSTHHVTRNCVGSRRIYEEISCEISSNGENNSKQRGTSGGSPNVEHYKSPLNDEAIYAVVRKNKANTRSVSSREAVIYEDAQVGCESEESLKKNEQVTAKTSRDFWKKLTKENVSDESDKTSVKIRHASQGATEIESPQTNNGVGLHRLPSTNVNNFIVIPRKNPPPPVAPRNTKSKRSETEHTNTKNNLHRHHCMEKPGYAIAESLQSIKLDDFEETSNGLNEESLSSCMIAIPRNTTICNSSTNAKKPFVITPANNRVISWN